jgi:hypothetical protein
MHWKTTPPPAAAASVSPNKRGRLLRKAMKLKAPKLATSKSYVDQSAGGYIHPSVSVRSMTLYGAAYPLLAAVGLGIVAEAKWFCALTPGGSP